MLFLDASMITKELALGRNELRLLFTLEKENKSLFSTDDAKRILKTSEASVWNVLYRLKRKGRVEEIERGKYLLVPARAGYEPSWSEVPLLLVPHLIDTYYVGFWTALNYWGMTEQVPRTMFIATTKRRRDVEYGPTKFEFVTLAKRRFFGFVHEGIAGGSFTVSSREKTIVDCLLYPRYCGGLEEAVKGIWNARKDLNFETLLDFSKRIGVSVVERRLGYVLDVLQIEKKMRSKLAQGKLVGFMWLDPLGPKTALTYSREYGLAINRTKDELTGWRGH
jgi:predicted transcriptional regulator of viral defense system